MQMSVKKISKNYISCSIFTNYFNIIRFAKITVASKIINSLNGSPCKRLQIAIQSFYLNTLLKLKMRSSLNPLAFTPMILQQHAVIPHNFTAVAVRLRATLWHSLFSQDFLLWRIRSKICRKYVITEMPRNLLLRPSLMGAFIETSFICIPGRITSIA